MSENNIKYHKDTSSAIEWKKKHPKGYRLVVNCCKQKLLMGEDCIHLSAILFMFVRDRKLKAPANIGNSLANVIQNDYPEFKGKFHIKQAPSVAAEKAAILRLLQNMLEI